VVAACALVWLLSWGLVSKIQSKNDILRRMKSDSLTQLKAKSQFFNEISHDFRQRLHGMQLLANAAGRSGARDTPIILSKFKSALADLQRCLDNFLEITRMETITVRAVPAQMSLQDVFQRLELLFEEAAQDQGINLKFRCTGLMLHTDEKILFRILENLISNAIKFSRGKVLVAARAREEHIDILVVDNGEGIPEGEKEGVFKAFFQGSTSRNGHSSGGYGLGLSIVMRSANLLNAKVRMTSKPGRGTSIRLQLPRPAS
jgi:signal transduction histidine kinase